MTCFLHANFLFPQSTERLPPRHTNHPHTLSRAPQPPPPPTHRLIARISGPGSFIRNKESGFDARFPPPRPYFSVQLSLAEAPQRFSFPPSLLCLLAVHRKSLWELCSAPGSRSAGWDASSWASERDGRCSPDRRAPPRHLPFRRCSRGPLEPLEPLPARCGV